MSKKQDLYDLLKEAGAELPEYDKITTDELEALFDSHEDSESKEKVKDVVVINNRKNPVSVDGVEITPNGSVTLTKEQTENEALMAKINHGVKTGVYSFGE